MISGVPQRKPQTREDVLAEKLEFENMKVTGYRVDGKTHPDVWKVNKPDTRDVIPPELPDGYSEAEVFHTMVENVISNVWAEMLIPEVPVDERSGVGMVIFKEMNPCFSPLDEEKVAGGEMLKVLFERYGDLRAGRHPGLVFGILWFKAWRLDLVLEALDVLEAVWQRGELRAEILKGIVDVLAMRLPLILARLEEIAAEPGPTSKRLAVAIDRMQERVNVINEMQGKLALEMARL